MHVQIERKKTIAHVVQRQRAKTQSLQSLRLPCLNPTDLMMKNFVQRSVPANSGRSYVCTDTRIEFGSCRCSRRMRLDGWHLVFATLAVVLVGHVTRVASVPKGQRERERERETETERDRERGAGRESERE